MVKIDNKLTRQMTNCFVFYDVADFFRLLPLVDCRKPLIDKSDFFHKFFLFIKQKIFFFHILILLLN